MLRTRHPGCRWGGGGWRQQCTGQAGELSTRSGGCVTETDGAHHRPQRCACCAGGPRAACRVCCREEHVGISHPAAGRGTRSYPAAAPSRQQQRRCRHTNAGGGSRDAAAQGAAGAGSGGGAGVCGAATGRCGASQALISTGVCVCVCQHLNTAAALLQGICAFGPCCLLGDVVL